ncbi:hypothetical protein FP804_01120, partial [archaeon]|nr:hypothetical protein [archaeon]
SGCDFDLYVKYNSQPTTSSYDGKGYTSSSDETVTISNPSTGYYYIMPYSYSGSGSYSIKATVTGGGGGGTTLGDAVDNTALTWTTGGNADWVVDTSTSYYGGDSAKSGTITHSQNTYIQTTITGPGTFTFYWKVSSESNYDYLRFYIDETEQTKISGSVSWAQKSYSISSGSHTLQWKYTKDGSVSSGSDCGWLDKVVFTGGDTELTSGVAYSDSLSAANDKDYYKINVPSGSTKLDVVLDGPSSGCDFDLYVKYNERPTTSSYDARGYTSSSDETVTINSPSTGYYYIMPYSYSGSGSYSIKATVTGGGGSSGSKYAVIVGINDYNYISDLSYCVNDANDWKPYLEGQGYIISSFLTNSQATETAIKNAI